MLMKVYGMPRHVQYRLYSHGLGLALAQIITSELPPDGEGNRLLVTVLELKWCP